MEFTARPESVKRRSHLRMFHAAVEGDEFDIQAKTIVSAFRKTLRRVGQGRMIVIQDRHLTLYGAVPVGSDT
jgi:hypothetical protein